MRALLPAIVLAFFLVVSPSLAAMSPLVVHEWGTFTSLQNANGRSIGGLNSDDEPLPPFVHRLADDLIAGDFSRSKGIPPVDPDVTIRLETPVIYFYPPDPQPVTADVSATFNGGYLTEFYPNADKTLDEKNFNRLQTITSETRGRLIWRHVTLATNSHIQPTDSPVWLAPRAVKAVSASVGSEVERYLFYRGVGHIDSPLRVCRTGDEMTISQRGTGATSWPAMWLADFRDNGSCAFREIKPQPAPANDAAAAIGSTFKDADYAPENVARLRAAMKQTLTASGLYPDEAEAMLETWKRSYFKGGGQRLFFIVPRSWTDRTLPLDIKSSLPVKLTRVMVGRIELVTQAQQKILARMNDRATPAAQLSAMYGQLGRFAGALVADELRAHPGQSAALLNFARERGIVPPASSPGELNKPPLAISD